MSSKTIICLANSWREQGHCIAGKEVKADGYGEWVRPVGSETSEQIEKSIGKQFNLLDIITIPVISRQDKRGQQTENWIIDTSRDWGRVRSVSYSEAQRALDLEPPQWMVEGANSSKGENDSFGGEAESSLCLIQVNSFTARKDDGYRAAFSFNDKGYDLKIMDAMIPTKYNIMKNINNVILCISLIGTFGAPKTKLIAGVIAPNIVS